MSLGRPYIVHDNQIALRHLFIITSNCMTQSMKGQGIEVFRNGVRVSIDSSGWEMLELKFRDKLVLGFVPKISMQTNK